MKQEMKVWIRGNSERGDEVINELVNRGGLNWGLLTGTNSKNDSYSIEEIKSASTDYDSHLIYTIGSKNFIDAYEERSEIARIIMEEYTEIKLPPLEVKYEFKPFDKVLVRQNEDNEWKCDFFSHEVKRTINSRFTSTPSNLFKLYYFCTSGNLYRNCIPYNDKTKHLVGTNLPWEGKE